MVEIIPAILPKNYEDLKDKISLVRGFTPYVQIDICDGIFVQNKTWPFTSGNDLDTHFRKILNEEEGLPFWEDIEFELDLMTIDAVENFDIYTKLGISRIVFHLLKNQKIEEFRDFLEGIDTYLKDNIEIGVALELNQDVPNIFPLINCVDFVQIMGIEKIGFQGQDFSKKCIEYIKILKERFPDLIISIDGGVDLETASLLVHEGVDRLVIGSAIFNKEDVLGTIEEFRNL